MARKASELTAEQLAAALDTLSPGARALLDLSFRRAYPDDELSAMLDVSRNEVVVRRVGALAQIADNLDLREDAEIEQMTERLAELPTNAWSTATPPPEPRRGDLPARPRSREPMAARRSESSAPNPPARRRRSLAIATALLVIAGGVTAAILIASDEDTKDTTTAGSATNTTATTGTTTATTDTRTTEPEQPPAQKLEPLAGNAGDASATARLTDDGGKRVLALDVKNLPDPQGGEYGIWLFTSIADAKLLGVQRSGTFDARLDLPTNAADYEFLDISLEPRDGNPNPSGETVLRARVDELLR